MAPDMPEIGLKGRMLSQRLPKAAQRLGPEPIPAGQSGSNPFNLKARKKHDHGRPFQIQEHHAPQGRAGQKALGDVFQAVARNHRRGQDGHARPGHEPSPARRDQRGQGAVDAQDNIQRAIDKASKGDGENYEEVRYEGYGPGGVAIIVEALTDNRNRTATNVRTAFAKNGGNLGASGAVSHGFDRLGLIEYPGKVGDEEKVSKPRSKRVPKTSRATMNRIRSGLRWKTSTKSPASWKRPLAKPKA
jgi:hypothetical protein